MENQMEKPLLLRTVRTGTIYDDYFTSAISNVEWYKIVLYQSMSRLDINNIKTLLEYFTFHNIDIRNHLLFEDAYKVLNSYTDDNELKNKILEIIDNYNYNYNYNK